MNYIADEIAAYIIENKCTIRQCSEKFNIPKSTVHNLCHKCSDYYKKDLEKILNYNLSQRALRGGLALWEKRKSKKTEVG